MHSLLPHTAPYTKCPATCAHVRCDLPSPEKAHGLGKTSSQNLGTFQFTHQKHFLRCYASCLTIQGPHWDTGVHQLLPQAALPHTLSSPAAAMLVPTTRKCFSPRPLQCVITALSPFWLQLGANTTSQSLHLPKIIIFSIMVKNNKKYQFWVSLLWISHLQSFWCTEGKLVQPPICLCNLVLLWVPIHPFQPTWSSLSFSPLADSGSGLPQADLLKLPFHLYLLCFPWKQSNLARVHTWRNQTLRTQVQIPKQKDEIDNLILPMSSKSLMTHQQAPSMPTSMEKKTKRKELGFNNHQSKTPQVGRKCPAATHHCPWKAQPSTAGQKHPK